MLSMATTNYNWQLWDKSNNINKIGIDDSLIEPHSYEHKTDTYWKHLKLSTDTIIKWTLAFE